LSIGSGVRDLPTLAHSVGEVVNGLYHFSLMTFRWPSQSPSRSTREQIGPVVAVA
jgi:hypothetical protein